MARPAKIAAEAREAFNKHDERGIHDLYAENVVLEAPGDVHIEGRDAATEFAMSWLTAFPDARTTVVRELEAGDWVIQQFTFEGTHEETLVGPAGEIPATHKRVKGRGLELMRVEKDKVAEDHLYFDQMQLLTQLGLVSETARA